MNYWEERIEKTKEILERTKPHHSQMNVTAENLKKLIQFYEKMAKKQESQTISN